MHLNRQILLVVALCTIVLSNAQKSFFEGFEYTDINELRTQSNSVNYFRFETDIEKSQLVSHPSWPQPWRTPEMIYDPTDSTNKCISLKMIYPDNGPGQPKTPYKRIELLTDDRLVQYQFDKDYWAGYRLYIHPEHLFNTYDGNTTLMGQFHYNHSFSQQESPNGPCPIDTTEPCFKPYQNPYIAIYIVFDDVNYPNAPVRWRLSRIPNGLEEDHDRRADSLMEYDIANDLGEVVKGQWIDWKFNVNMSSTNGKLKIYKNDVLIRDFTNTQTVTHNPDKQYWYFKVGMYKPLWIHRDNKAYGGGDATVKRILLDDVFVGEYDMTKDLLFKDEFNGYLPVDKENLEIYDVLGASSYKIHLTQGTYERYFTEYDRFISYAEIESYLPDPLQSFRISTRSPQLEESYGYYGDPCETEFEHRTRLKDDYIDGTFVGNSALLCYPVLGATGYTAQLTRTSDNYRRNQGMSMDCKLWLGEVPPGRYEVVIRALGLPEIEYGDPVYITKY